MSDKKIRARVIKEFRDKKQKMRWMSLGYVQEFPKDRFDELAEKGLVEEYTEEAEKVTVNVRNEKNKTAGPPQRKRAAE